MYCAGRERAAQPGAPALPAAGAVRGGGLPGKSLCFSWSPQAVPTCSETPRSPQSTGEKQLLQPFGNLKRGERWQRQTDVRPEELLGCQHVLPGQAAIGKPPLREQEGLGAGRAWGRQGLACAGSDHQAAASAAGLHSGPGEGAHSRRTCHATSHHVWFSALRRHRQQHLCSGSSRSSWPRVTAHSFAAAKRHGTWSGCSGEPSAGTCAAAACKRQRFPRGLPPHHRQQGQSRTGGMASFPHT